VSSKTITHAIETSADPERARPLFEQLSPAAREAGLNLSDAEQSRILAAVFSGSRMLGNMLTAHPDWFAVLETERLR
jgi:hypothetical protein